MTKNHHNATSTHEYLQVQRTVTNFCFSFLLVSSPHCLARGAGVPAAPRGLPAAARDSGQPVCARPPAAGQGRLAARQRQRGRGHLPHAHRVLLAHLHLAAAVQPAPARQLLLPHRQGDAMLLRRAGRRADGRVGAHRAGGSHPQRDRRPHAGQTVLLVKVQIKQQQTIKEFHCTF